MKRRTLAAPVAAACAIAAGTVSSAASAATCDLGWNNAVTSALLADKQAMKMDKGGEEATAAAYELIAWRTYLNAPIP